jgi:hypothetical protein
LGVGRFVADKTVLVGFGGVGDVLSVARPVVFLFDSLLVSPQEIVTGDRLAIAPFQAVLQGEGDGFGVFIYRPGLGKTGNPPIPAKPPYTRLIYAAQ